MGSSLTIEIPQVDLPPNEILLKDYGQSITFFKDFIHLQSAGKWKKAKDDDQAIMEELFFDNIAIIHKEAPFPIEMYYYNAARKYVLEIDKIKIFFGDNDENPKTARERCKDLLDKIIQWKYQITI